MENIGLASLTGIQVVTDGPGKANFNTTKILKTSLSPNLSTSFKVRLMPSKISPVAASALPSAPLRSRLAGHPALGFLYEVDQVGHMRRVTAVGCLERADGSGEICILF